MKTQLKAIRAIDPAAADYIETEVLPRYGKKRLKELFPPRWKFWKKRTDREVINLFVWYMTPQRHEYWDNIWRAINGKKSH